MSQMLGDYFKSRGVPMTEISPGLAGPAAFGVPADEHLATRRAAGLFDFSFMGCFEIRGAGAAAFVDHVQTRSLAHLERGRIAYTLLLRHDGSVLNDATAWRDGSDAFRLFTGRRSDLAHLRMLAASFPVVLTDRTDDYAVIAVQGPRSWRVIDACWPGRQLIPPAYFSFVRLDFDDRPCWLARLGYSGETGCELVVEAAVAARLWQRLRAVGEPLGLVECGFTAIDGLRIEAGHILFARELKAALTPLELGLSRLVALRRSRFHGSPALRERMRAAPRCRLVGLLPKGSDVPARAEVLEIPAAGIAACTSSTWSPLFARPLALGLVSTNDRYPGTLVRMADGRSATVARLPFYDPAKILPRKLPRQNSGTRQVATGRAHCAPESS